MNGRAYVQNGDRFGWIKRDHKYVIPKSAEDVVLTADVAESLVFDVDNRDGFSLLNSLISNGYSVVIGDTYIHRNVAEPSASPFTTLA